MARGEEEQAASQWRPRPEDMSLTVVLLVKVFDRLGELTARQMAEPLPKGAKKPVIPPAFPQPVRALDLALAKVEQQYLDELDQDVVAAQARWAAQQAKEAGDGRGD